MSCSSFCHQLHQKVGNITELKVRNLERAVSSLQASSHAAASAQVDSDEDSVTIEMVVQHRVSVKTGLLEFKIKGSDGGNVWVRHEEAEELCPTQLREFFVNNPGVEDSLKGKKKRSRLVKDVVAVFRQEKRDRKEQNKVTHAMLKKVAKENKKKGGTRKKAATKKKTAGPSTPVQPKSPRTAVPPSSRRTPPTPSSASSVGSKV